MKKQSYLIFGIYYNEKKDDFVSLVYRMATDELYIIKKNKRYGIPRKLKEEVESVLHYMKHQLKNYSEVKEMYIWYHKTMPHHITRLFKTKNNKYFVHYLDLDEQTKELFKYNSAEYNECIKQRRKNPLFGQETFLNLKKGAVPVNTKIMKDCLR